MIQRYRRISGPTETPDGFPLPLSGKPLTKTSVVVKKEGVELKEYPAIYVPRQEELGADEIRLTCCGSGNPPVRRAQDLTVINITPEQIVTRQAETNLLHGTPPPPPNAPRGTLGARSEAKIPQWLVDSVIQPAE